MQAAKLGHAHAAYEADKMLRILGMEGNINPEAHNKNLEETNKKVELPPIAKSWRLPKEGKLQYVEDSYTVKRTNHFVVQKNAKPSANESSNTEDKNKTSDLKELKRKAKAGDMEAQYTLGKRYIKLARRNLEKASAQGHNDAQLLHDKITRENVPPTVEPEPELPHEPAAAPIPEITIGSGQIDAETGVLHLSYTSSPERTEITITLKELWKNICLYLRQNFAPFIAKNPRR